MSVSIGDVKGWLSESSLDLGTLCQSSNIDANKLYKPIRNSSTTSLSNRDSDGISYTIYTSGSAAKTAASGGSSTSWLRGSYDKPRGSGYSEYYRLTDFEGYNTSSCLSGGQYTRSGELSLSSGTYSLTLYAAGFNRFRNQISSTCSSYSYKHYGFIEWSNYDSSWRSLHTNGNVTSTEINSISLSYSDSGSGYLAHFHAGYTYYYMPFISFTSGYLTNGDDNHWFGGGHSVDRVAPLPVPWISFVAPSAPTPPDPNNFVEIYIYSITGRLDSWNGTVYTDTASIYVFNNSDYSLSNVSVNLQVTTNYGTYGVGSFYYGGGSTLSSHSGGSGTCSGSSSCSGTSQIVTYTVTVQYKCTSLSSSWFNKTASQQVVLQQ